MPGKRPAKNPPRPRNLKRFQADFIGKIAPENHFQVALNHLGNTSVVVKDAAGRFVWASDSLARRFGFANAADMIGLNDYDINPPRLVNMYRLDDLAVMRSGQPMLGKLELVFGQQGMLDWNVTNKLPLRDCDGQVIGLIVTIQKYRGMRHLPVFGGELRAVVEYILAHIGEPLRLADLAKIACISSRQLERRFRNATGLSPTDFIIRARLDEACRRLREGEDSIGRIALDVGFYDQSAMTRLFHQHLGATPSEFRQMRGRSCDES